MARPRKQTYTMAQYLENVNEGYITNNADTQRNPAWKPIVDGLAVTILTDDYIPSIILAEEDNGEKKVVDGGSRTAAFMMLRYGNYKIKSSVENPIIKYKKMNKDEKGKTVWEETEFDIRNKTYDQFPKELQKAFNEYQVETVIHECDAEGIAMYLRRYNIHTAMNANQRMFVHLPRHANKVRSIADRQFFINHSNITDVEKEKGMLERVISESVMCMFHLDKWNKNGKNMASYLNDNASDNEFEVLEGNLERLESIITDDVKDVFNSKDSFIWLTFFNKFTKLGIKDGKFVEFLKEFKGGLREKQVEGKLFDKVDQSGSTKDKSVIVTKLHILETLMNEFLLINKEDLEEVDYIEFVKANVEDIIDSDIYEVQMVANDVSEVLDSEHWMLSEQNYPAYLALVGMAFRVELEDKLKEWLPIYVKNNEFMLNQQKAFLHMKNSFEKYIQKVAVA